MWLQSRRRDVPVPPERALPGRPDYDYPLAHVHDVLGTSMLGPFPTGVVTLYLGMGCFWGAEKRLWQLPGVHTTAAGYQGGSTPHPTYSEVCTGITGHAEMVMVAYDPTVVATIDVLRVFWENHDPTQGMRQGNDVGSQYRSAVYWSTHEQQALVESSAAAYDEVLRVEGFDPITTELAPALQDGEVLLPFYYAEAHHQQYLHKFTAMQVLIRQGGRVSIGRTLAGAAGATLLLMFIAAVAMLDAERGAPEASRVIKTFGDAVWWSGTTVTTVGYGDMFPVTWVGRWVAFCLMLVGISMIGVVTASIAAWFVGRSEEVESDLLAEIRALSAKVDQLQAERSAGD